MHIINGKKDTHKLWAKLDLKQYVFEICSGIDSYFGMVMDDCRISPLVVPCHIQGTPSG